MTLCFFLCALRTMSTTFSGGSILAGGFYADFRHSIFITDYFCWEKEKAGVSHPRFRISTTSV